MGVSKINKRLCAFRTQPFVLFSNHLFLPASLLAVGTDHFARAPHVRRKESAFEGCVKLTLFRAPGLTQLPVAAFDGCESLKTADLPRVETFLSDNGYSGAFQNCESLENVTLSSAFKGDTLPNAAFYGRMNQFTVALNWHWNPQTRWGLNWICAKPVSGSGGSETFGTTLNTLACQFRITF